MFSQTLTAGSSHGEEALTKIEEVGVLLFCDDILEEALQCYCRRKVARSPFDHSFQRSGANELLLCGEARHAPHPRDGNKPKQTRCSLFQAVVVPALFRDHVLALLLASTVAWDTRYIVPADRRENSCVQSRSTKWPATKKLKAIQRLLPLQKLCVS